MTKMKWMASLAASAILLTSMPDAGAQYVQIPIGNPIAPGCGPGESWTKNGARYVCESPAPSCAFGFASGPVWTGTAWSFVCNAPPVTPPPVSGDPPPGQIPTNRETCQAMATSLGFGTLGPVISDEIGNGFGNQPAENVNYSPTIGPTYETVAGTTGNTYQVACVTYVATGQIQPVNGFVPFELEDNDVGGAGGG
jgi:hypothetical protein